MSDADTLIVKESASPISFATEGGGSWKVWDRFLAVHGVKVHHIGNVCGTCAFFFTRLPVDCPRVEAGAVAADLRAGIREARGSAVESMERLLPDGRYRPMLRQVQPKRVETGGPDDYFANESIESWDVDPVVGASHDPRASYYRLPSRDIGAGTLFEFLVPLFPVSTLSAPHVGAYERALESGALPTAVAISVLDAKEPEGDGSATPARHWCLAHYLIDGHHKVLAASRTARPLTLLSFLALDQGVSTEAEVEELRGVLSPPERAR